MLITPKSVAVSIGLSSSSLELLVEVEGVDDEELLELEDDVLDELDESSSLEVVELVSEEVPLSLDEGLMKRSKTEQPLSNRAPRIIGAMIFFILFTFFNCWRNFFFWQTIFDDKFVANIEAH